MSDPRSTAQAAEKLLRQVAGQDATFHEGQREAITALVEDRSRLLVVQRTGWGKSAVYFIATALLRLRGSGPTILISPLLSLMRNQIQMAQRLGIRAASITSEKDSDWQATARDLANGEIDILLVSPERLGNQHFLREVLPRIKGGIGMFVIDEAHCISDWGHDFRPDYRRIVRVLQTLPVSIPVLATTATANNRVVADIKEQLGQELIVIRGPLARRELRLHSLTMPSQKERYAWLAQSIPNLTGSGIVYCLTVADCERVAAWLNAHEIEARPYHSDVPDRPSIEAALIANEIKVVVATVALGMGFDKPDLGFIIHFQRPSSVVAYYQQVGRAGRGGESAYAILLNGSEDEEIQDYFISTAFPDPAHLTEILDALAASDGLTKRQLAARVNVAWGRLDNALKMLEIEGAITREESIYSRTARTWVPDIDRWNHVTALRRQEQDEMRQFARSESCLMEFITRVLDDPQSAPCGVCSFCQQRPGSRSVNPALAAEAEDFLTDDHGSIPPKAQFPAGLRGPSAMAIPVELRPEPGLYLTMYGSATLGALVRNGKWKDGHFPDHLVSVAARVIPTRIHHTPTWLTYVPSITHPDLVKSFAERLARKFGLPCIPVLTKAPGFEPQKRMQNSAFQATNAERSFSLRADSLPDGPVLLVDDMIDSGWTLTMCAIKLREQGSGPVIPFAIAKLQGGDQ